MNATSRGVRTCVMGLAACCLWFGSVTGSPEKRAA